MDFIFFCLIIFSISSSLLNLGFIELFCQIHAFMLIIEACLISHGHLLYFLLGLIILLLFFIMMITSMLNYPSHQKLDQSFIWIIYFSLSFSNDLIQVISLLIHFQLILMNFVDFFVGSFSLYFIGWFCILYQFITFSCSFFIKYLLTYQFLMILSFIKDQ